MRYELSWQKFIRIKESVTWEKVSAQAYQFDEANAAQISALKWHFLLERVVVRVAALPPSNPDGMLWVSILTLEIACPLEVAQNIPMN